MTKRATVQNINPAVLRQCREQMALSIDEVKKKVKSIEKIEAGEQKLTFKQLEVLSDLYAVPEWVFISDKIPQKYIFEKSIPSFRKFTARGDVFSGRLRRLTKKVTEFRELILDLREDMDEKIRSFDIPTGISDNQVSNAKIIRRWLGVGENVALDFDKWREKLEEKEIFIFLSSKFKGWSHLKEANVRGMAIYYEKLPVIVINDSDAYKAQTFTLFHELGHLLRRSAALDTKWEELWCNELAGNVLMPAEKIQGIDSTSIDLDTIGKLAKAFKVSHYALLVRLHRLDCIDNETYDRIEPEIRAQIDAYKERMKGGPPRQRAKEVQKQYGSIYTGTLFQSYYNRDITLHKLCLAFDLKRVSHLQKLEGQL